MVAAPDVAVSTPIKISPAELKASHAAQATLVEGAKDEAKLDIKVLLSNTDKEARDNAAEELVNLVKTEGPNAFVRLGLAQAIQDGLNDKKSPIAREGACSLISTLCEQGVGHAVEPFIFEKVLQILLNESLGDKVVLVKQAAQDALRNVIQVMTPWATATMLTPILHEIKTNGKWQIKLAALDLLDQLIVAAADQMALALPTILPVLTEVIWDTKPEVKKASRATLTKVCNLVSNKDIEKFIPALINCLINPDVEVPKTIILLSATTFVSEVDSPTLALMVPLLTRGLNERATATKRKVAVITDNMTKLVDNERIVRPFVPKILPGLIKAQSAIADPDVRKVFQKAIEQVRETAKVEGDGSNAPAPIVITPESLVPHYLKAFSQTSLSEGSPLVHYIANISANLCNARDFDNEHWNQTLIPYVTLAGVDAAQATTIVRKVLEASAADSGETALTFDDEEEGEDLCNCTFSLAYGAKILLNTATLRLKRGHRYGLCGRNGSGKSTLMTAIVNGQVEGFPSPDVVRTWYVAHDIDGSEAETSCLQFILQDKRISASEQEIKETMTSVGFNEERQNSPISGLSGGWKMKLALARAILFKADILLLDEPTNHLDVLNIAWLENYLNSLTQCTSIIVSHDSGFLNNVCTDILHLNRFKVKRYPGNLEAFVKHVPEAKAYYELNPAEDYTFRFPKPPLLDGVKTKEKSIMKMRKVGFQYPTSKTQQLKDITLQVSLSSRVGVLGPNGSGKSTLVKLLVGDMEPNKGGEVWKHPNLVVGYIAQHAFHHIEKYLDLTPLDYMLKRYSTGEDLEELEKVQNQLTPEDEKKMKDGALYVHEGQKRTIEDIISRRKLKQSYEYEVSFKGMSSTENLYIPRDELVKRGFEKKVQSLDTKEAQRLGMNRPLVRKEVEAHFNDFGLESEFVSHNSMRGLSGGQKVKVVLASATWRRPHVIILDEPSNYLDRESLAALVDGLKAYEGGVLVITHNIELSQSVASEVWAMSDGELTPSGHNWVEGQGSGARIDKAPDEEVEMFDAMGNKIDPLAKTKKLTSSEARKKKKDRMARRKRGEEVFTDEE